MKIGLIGSMSTGKTTLAKQFDNNITDVEREVINEYGGDVSKITDLVSFQKDVARHQANKEYQFGNNFVTDNPLRTSLAYCRVVGDEGLNRWINEYVRQYANYDLLFFIPIEFPLVADGVRHADRGFQIRIQAELLKVLEENSLPYTVITGSIEERKNKFLSLII